jgi:hypothetical protein
MLQRSEFFSWLFGGFAVVVGGIYTTNTWFNDNIEHNIVLIEKRLDAMANNIGDLENEVAILKRGYGTEAFISIDEKLTKHSYDIAVNKDKINILAEIVK